MLDIIRQRGWGARLVLAVLLAMAALSSAAKAAPVPYEPNDSIPAAAGPLLFGQTYLAGLETPGDRDFFSFYVTSVSPTPVTLAVRNLGGATGVSDIDATILDATGGSVAAVTFVDEDETRAATVTLQPQKYYVEVVPNEGFGDGYSLSAAGGGGAFGAYAQIAGRCASARERLAVTESRLRRAEARLQRAIGRRRRARYGNRAGREAARAVYRKARRKVGRERDGLNEARSAESPWCSIAQ